MTAVITVADRSRVIETGADLGFFTSVKKKSDRAWSAQGVVDAEGG